MSALLLLRKLEAFMFYLLYVSSSYCSSSTLSTRFVSLSPLIPLIASSRFWSLHFFFYLSPTCLFSTLALCSPVPRGPLSPVHSSTLSPHLLSTHSYLYKKENWIECFTCFCLLLTSSAFVSFVLPLISSLLLSSFPLLLSSLFTSFSWTAF